MDNKLVERVDWIDITKGIAIFLMVCGHTGIPQSLSNWIWSFHMPLFFFISGLLYNPDKYCCLCSLLKKRTRTLLIPFMFFSVIALFMTSDSSFLSWMRHGWLNGCALWFIPVLFLTEMISYAIIKYLKKYMCFCGILIATIGYLLYLKSIRLPYNVDVCFYASLFYLLGYYFRDVIKNYNFKTYMIFLFAASNIAFSQLLPRTDMACNQCGWYGLNAINAIIGTLMVISLSKSFAYIPFKKFFMWGGKNSIVILGLSQILNMSLKGIMENLHLPSVLSSGFRHIVLWILLWWISIIINRYFPLVIGKKFRKK